MASFLIALLLTSSISISVGDVAFDVRRHLSTVTRYDTAKSANIESFINYADTEPSIPSVIPDGCSAIHLNLVARHGTRSPTTKRIEELNILADRIDTLLNNAEKEAEQNIMSSVNIPAWLWGWKSPWLGKKTGGELTSQGEDELYLLGKRIKENFIKLFDEEYHPDVFSIRATQVPRVSASAVAFGIGLFSGKGNLGPGNHRAFSVITESQASDTCLRFFDTCGAYKKHRKNQEPSITKIKDPILDSIAFEVGRRYRLNFTKQDIASLCFLCKQEASLLDVTDRARGLFNASEVSLFEWTDDIEGFLINGYGNSVNYRMGIPLLNDVVESMERAIIVKEENHADGTYEKARLRFAHAETVAPLTCLLGLFLDKFVFEQIQREEPLDLPSRPPEKRYWKGSVVAPFAGNTMLVLYACHGNGSSSFHEHKNSYFVQVLHNEIPVSLVGCDNRVLCPWKTFKEQIMNPHFKHTFESVCST